jgi:hypothetical protein
MYISRTSPVTGRVNTRNINVTTEMLDAWRNGALIQDVMPFLSADDREFIISGCTPEDWEYLYGDEGPF